jgi:uncharacterized membrane protein
VSILILGLLALHIGSAAGLVAGVIGRNLALALARRTTSLAAVERHLRLAEPCERLLVIPCSNIVLVTGVGLAWLKGWPILGFLQGSQVNWVLTSLLLYLATIPLVVCIFLPRGRRFEAALEGARAQGRITTELNLAFRDRAVWMARGAEYLIAAAIIYLMLAKPF